jgi:glycosyltransferase involved in cell wall biosynthesis
MRSPSKIPSAPSWRFEIETADWKGFVNKHEKKYESDTKMTVFYSIIIPAYNEAGWLPSTLAFLRKSMASFSMPGEIIVVDNNSTDRTAQIAHRFRARVIFEPVNQISRARNAGARVARGDYFIFLDADTFLSEGLIRHALIRLSEGRCCGGGARVSFSNTVPKLLRAALGIWNRCSKAFGVAAGCFIFCLRQGFEEVGGFSEQVYASEELWFSRGLKSWGKKKGMRFHVINDPPIVTSNRKLQWISLPQMILILFICLFPFIVRSRSLCAFWYRRPSKIK